jgi:hypothetical protein
MSAQRWGGQTAAVPAGRPGSASEGVTALMRAGVKEEDTRNMTTPLCRASCDPPPIAAISWISEARTFQLEGLVSQ